MSNFAVFRVEKRKSFGALETHIDRQTVAGSTQKF